MIKFKITREKTTSDEKVISDRLRLKTSQVCVGQEVIESEYYLNFCFDTKDLPDLIKALQDKEKEIMK